MTRTDSQGVVLTCECICYEPDEDDDYSPCVVCDHSPEEHVGGDCYGDGKDSP